MFDQDYLAVEDAKNETVDVNNVMRLDICKIQEYVFDENFNAIYIRWAITYLERDAQLDYLRRAKAALNNMREK